MFTTLTIHDETTSPSSFGNVEFALNLPISSLTVRELIRFRIQAEVQEYNSHQHEFFRGLVQPADAEQTLNGYRLREKHLIEWEPQYDQALKAFEQNGFVLLIDDVQVENLDQMIDIRPETSITFLKLVPLVGG